MEQEQDRRHPLRSEDIELIVEAVVEKMKQAFYIDAEKHYNDHQKLGVLLKAYEEAHNIFIKAFLSLIIIGAILLAGVGFWKGPK